MYQFTYWLENFKEFSPGKAQSTIKVLLNLSKRAENCCKSVERLEECNTLATFNRTKQAILRSTILELNQSEKRALSLFGDFREFCEYSNFKFPDAPPSKLHAYCQTMQMSYSYKAVLILAIINLIKAGTSTTIDSVICEMIGFYKDRISKNKYAEKSNSIFATNNYDQEDAKKIVVNNPVKVLVDAGIIIYNQRTGELSFTMEYNAGNEEYQTSVKNVCNERLEGYYASIELNKISGHKSLKDTGISDMRHSLCKLKAIIEKVKDEDVKRNLETIYQELFTCVNNSGTDNVTCDNNNTNAALSCDDNRKIGKLVKDCMQLLEDSKYPFSDEDLQNFQSAEWSKSCLKLYYPFFRLYDEGKTLAEQKVDHLGNGRYWKRIYSFNGNTYLITSEWYKESKPLFIEWFNQLPKKSV